MAPSMYELTVPVLLRGLAVLSDYVDKAAAFAAENNIDPTVLVTARLAPDMQSFAGQIQRASDNAKGAMVRLAGIEPPSFPDTETNFEELKARIAKTVALLNAITPDQLVGAEDRVVEMKFRSAAGRFSGAGYLTQILLPNFFFHVTTAHDILRHNGLKIGKLDYFGKLEFLETVE